MKSLRALDETASEDTPAKVLADSTDDDLAEPVPNVPGDVVEAEAQEEGRHDADDFVPRQDRGATLEGDSTAYRQDCLAASHPEVVIIDADEDEAKEKEEEVPEGRPGKDEGISGTPSIEPVGSQPAPPSLNLLSGASSSIGSASARARSVPTSRSDDLGFCTTFKTEQNISKIY